MFRGEKIEHRRTKPGATCMPSILSTSAEWIFANLTIILGISALIYVSVFVRFLFYWIVLYRVQTWQELPASISMPLDVKIGLGIALVLSCGAMDYALLIKYPNVGEFIIVLIINILLVTSSLAAILMPLRQYKVAISTLKQHQNDKHHN